MVRGILHRLILIIYSVGLLLILGGVADPVRASDNLQSSCGDLSWQTNEVGSFIVFYTSSTANLADQIISNFGDQLESEFQKYAVLFGTALDTPIAIRVYPTRADYECLNTLAPIINDDDTHSHIGGLEIALIGEAINQSQDTWYSTAINGMRHEFASLYVEKDTDGNAPPGLVQGIGGYFEDPGETFEDRYFEAGNIQSPTRSIQRLLEEDIPASNSLILLQQTSIVAFLIDVYGWDLFLEFLAEVGESSGYRQGFTSVYGLSIQEVQAEWETYFPLYISGRWRLNIIHHFDLDRYDVLIAAGVYQDAYDGLVSALPIVTLFGETDELERAQGQFSTAEQGVLAGTLTFEARQALLDGNYSDSIEKSEDAITIYTQLNDSRRIGELETYRDMAFEILTLRTELESLRGIDTPLDPQKTQRILQIGQRLSELGDAEGVRDVQVTMILLSTGQRYFVEWTTIIGLLVCIVLVYRRIRDLFRKKTAGGEFVMNVEKFFSEINRIFQLAFTQKAFKVVLRSAWVGGAVYLLFWGANRLFDILNNSIVWLIAGILTTVLSLATLFFNSHPDKKFIWRLDQRFDLKEQVVTAFELFSGEDANPVEEDEDEESITNLLARDAATPLPGIRRRIANNGWYLRPEFESTLVVLILLLIVYLNGVSVITQLPPGGMVSILPVMEDDPTAAEVLSGGNAESGQSVLGQDTFFPNQGNSNPTYNIQFSSEDCDDLSHIFRRLGRKLEDDSITYYLADSLQKEAYGVAADDIGYLAENISTMTEASRRKLGNQFLEAAVSLQDAGLHEVSKIFQDASAALFENSFSVMSENLDELAQMMQSLVVQCRGIEIYSEQAFEFDVMEDDESVQVPGESDLLGSGFGTSEDFETDPGNPVSDSDWQYYDLLLEDIDVVSTYFSTQ